MKKNTVSHGCRAVILFFSCAFLSSCWFTQYGGEVHITGGYVAEGGDRVVLDVFIRDLSPEADPAEFYWDFAGYPVLGGLDITPAVISVEGFQISPGYRCVMLNGTAEQSLGPELTATIDTAWETSYSEVEFAYFAKFTMSPEQETSIPIRNQFYVAAPTYTDPYTLYFTTDAEGGPFQRLGSSALNRISIELADVALGGSHPVLRVDDWDTNERTYLLSDGSRVNDLTPFDSAIVLTPGGVLDASLIIIGP